MLSFIAICFLILLLIDYQYRKTVLKKLNGFPVVYGIPFFGMILQTINPKNLLPYGEKQVQVYKDSAYLFVMFKPYLLVADGKTAETILGSTTLIEKAKDYEFFKSVFGTNSLLISKGENWRNRRKILTPAFHYKILEDFCTIFENCGNNLVKKLKDNANSNPFDVHPIIALHTLDIICETAMGTKINALDNPNSPYVKSWKVICDVIYQRLFSLFSRFDCIYRFLPLYKREMKARDIINTFSEEIIKQRRGTLTTQMRAPTSDEFGIKNRQTFLDILLTASINGENLSDQDILEEVNTFIFEGHDTTAAAISFALYCLSKNVDVQQKVYEEIKSIFQNEDEISLQKLQNLSYTEMTIKESLRLYPSVPAFSRTLPEDAKCRGATIPKGLDVAIVPYGLHRNPSIYPDPLRFDPTRFSLENCMKRNPYDYIPFSAGPRNCIGQKFAMLEIKMTLVKILLNYQIIEANASFTVQPVSKVTIYSDNGIQIRLLNRSD